MTLGILTLGRRKSWSFYTPSPGGMLVSYLLLGIWAFMVLFPLYWLAITSFKQPIDVNSGPVYVPFVDFKPTMDNWHYIFFDLRNDTFRPYFNTVGVSLISTTLTLIFGAAAAYGLVRFAYRPRLATILVFIGCAVFAIFAITLGLDARLAIVIAIALFFLMLQTIARRFERSLGNNDIAFWLISQRMLPPVAVVIPLYVLFQRFSLLDTWAALIITYTAVNLPIVVWLMRDYFQTIPREVEENAAIDGASPYRIFWSIVLPLSVPGLVATFLFVLVFAWNEYLIALFLTIANAQTMPLTVAAQNATRGPQWWYMSVLILIMIVPVIAMAIALERYMARGLLIGAIKG
jgi:multiple sugar transport system permease protein